MSSLYKTTAIILGSWNIGEHDRIVSCFTKEYGRVDLFAKAVRKITSKLRAGLEPLTFSYLEFAGGFRSHIVTEAIPLRNFYWGSAMNAEARSAVARAAHFLAEVIAGTEKDETFLDFFLSSLSFLVKTPLHAHHLAYWELYVKWNILKRCGLAPELYQCISCHKKILSPPLFFSGEGGVRCASCGEGDSCGPMSVEALKFCRLAQEGRSDIIFSLEDIGKHRKYVEQIFERCVQGLRSGRAMHGILS